MPKVGTEDLIALARAAAAEAANFQDRFAAEDTEARKIVDIMERFLRVKGRVVYGGAAINAHLPREKQFYDPNLYLPDYDFMTPDPLQDCADLIVAFQAEGFIDVEAKFGIHEGTYKVFVNYRSAADITYMPPEIYARVASDADVIDGILYASVNFLRMNIYLELSRPAGMVSRWEKVYERLLLLNETHPIRPGRCPATPLGSLAAAGTQPADRQLHNRIVGVGMSMGAIFLSGVSYLAGAPPSAEEPVLMLVVHRHSVLAQLQQIAAFQVREVEAQGEILPARTELRYKNELVAILFETVACHSYTTLADPQGYRLGSLDLLIQMYYAMYFADLDGILPVRMLCLIQELIDMEATQRQQAVKQQLPPHDVFPLECVGHQPTMPELKKAHRKRVLEKRKELASILPESSGVRVHRRRRGRKHHS
jgi:hypothetical protein